MRRTAQEREIAEAMKLRVLHVGSNRSRRCHRLSPRSAEQAVQIPIAAASIAKDPQPLTAGAHCGVIVAAYVALVPPTAFNALGCRAELDDTAVIAMCLGR